jgi:hypothetical protein
MKMKRTVLLSRRALAGAVAASMLAQQATASEIRATDKLVGAWSLVSLVVDQGDKQVEVFGPHPRGIQVMSHDGRFAVVTMREELPLYASGNRMQGTPDEYEAIGKGTNAAYGRYTVDEAAGTVTFHVEASTFPNWDGGEQVRAFKLEGDSWSYVNSVLTIGPGNAHVVWERLR